MRDASHLIDLAEKCRRFARGADDLTSARLLKLADEYTALADIEVVTASLEATTERIIHRENIAHYRWLLTNR